MTDYGLLYAAGSVHDVVAHLAGTVTDVLGGRLDGVGSDPWTAAQVGTRRDMPIAALVGVCAFEGPHDPFFPLALAAEHTERVDLSTAIAVAFARSPMNLAYIGHDLQALARGRVILGLGSQIRPHIENRFSMPWSRPA